LQQCKINANQGQLGIQNCKEYVYKI